MAPDKVQLQKSQIDRVINGLLSQIQDLPE